MAFTAFRKSKLVKRVTLILLPGIFLCLLAFYIALRWQFFGVVPTVDELKSISNYNASEVVAINGELLGKYFIYDRTSVSLEEISDHVVDALIATEDVRFFRHGGLDFRSMGRVLVKGILLGQDNAGGGSTLTLQLAKNLYPRTKGGVFRLLTDKAREVLIAGRLERVYSKEEILLLYLNTVAFGDNVFGISSASYRFFNMAPDALRLEEAALLVGMLKATTAYNPRLYPEQAVARRNTVLEQMRKYGYISSEASDSLKAIALEIRYTPVSHIHGPAPYFREWIRHQLLDILHGYNVRNGTSVNLYTEGLKITTTLDFALQLQAEETLRQHMLQLQSLYNKQIGSVSAAHISPLPDQLVKRTDRYKKLSRMGKSEAEIMENFNEPIAMPVFDWNGDTIIIQSPFDSLLMNQALLHGSLVSIEVGSGHIKAWVGGNSFRFFQYDHVLSGRQPGSAFKPFVYAAAIESGMAPCDYISNGAVTFPEYDHWSPANADGSYDGYYSMNGALSNSVNTIAVKVLQHTGIEQVIDLARRAGIRSDMPHLPSLALGAFELSLLEMTAAYGIFSRTGAPMVPQWLLKIEGPAGELYYEAGSPSFSEQVLSADIGQMITAMLRNTTKTGTAAEVGRRLNPAIEVAGKTGTTQHNADSWFVGYTPGLITGVWVGIENPAFARSYPLPFGASRSAAVIWAEYIQAAYHHHDTRHFVAGSFSELPGHLSDMLDCEDYLDELPRPSWFERIFGRSDDQPAEETDDQDKPKKRKGLLRRILEEIF